MISSRSPGGFFILVFLLLTQCDVINPEEEVPAYLYISAIELQTDETAQGRGTSAFDDAWVFANSELIGAFELPARIPVLSQGETDIQVFPGFRDRGLSTDRAIFQLVSPLDTVLNLRAGRVDSLRPVVRYRPEAEFAYLLDFDDQRQRGFRLDPESSASAESRISSERAVAGSALRVSVGDTGFAEMDAIRENQAVVQAQAAVMEFDLYNEALVLVASEVAVAQGGELNRLTEVDEAGYTARPRWRRQFIDLGSDMELFRGEGFTQWKPLFAFVNTDTTGPQVSYIDNLKVVYLP
jgi:hypothetical protein